MSSRSRRPRRPQRQRGQAVSRIAARPAKASRRERNPGAAASTAMRNRKGGRRDGRRDGRRGRSDRPGDRGHSGHSGGHGRHSVQSINRRHQRSAQARPGDSCPDCQGAHRQEGRRITSHIALPGRSWCSCPRSTTPGSRARIESDGERRRLKEILLSEKGDASGGFIVRTAAEGATKRNCAAISASC